MTVINLGIDGLKPDVLVRRYLIAPRLKTQAKMNRAYIIDADVQLAFRLQLLAKVLSVGCWLLSVECWVSRMLSIKY